MFRFLGIVRFSFSIFGLITLCKAWWNMSLTNFVFATRMKLFLMLDVLPSAVRRDSYCKDRFEDFWSEYIVETVALVNTSCSCLYNFLGSENVIRNVVSLIESIVSGKLRITLKLLFCAKVKTWRKSGGENFTRWLAPLEPLATLASLTPHTPCTTYPVAREGCKALHWVQGLVLGARAV